MKNIFLCYFVCKLFYLLPFKLRALTNVNRINVDDGNFFCLWIYSLFQITCVVCWTTVLSCYMTMIFNGVTIKLVVTHERYSISMSNIVYICKHPFLGLANFLFILTFSSCNWFMLWLIYVYFDHKVDDKCCDQSMMTFNFFLF